jgi:heme O synthase-like polyprenyltransferase
MRKKLAFFSFFSALGEGIYILLVALVMRNANQWFGNTPSISGIIAFLLLFVVSAAVSGALIFGKPVLLYLEGKKKEALELFGLTIGWLFIFFVILLLTTAIK